MQWTLEGADRDTGKERTLVLEADIRHEAERLAAARGLLISSVRADEEELLPGLEELGAAARQHGAAIQYRGAPSAQQAALHQAPAVPSYAGLVIVGNLLRVLAGLLYFLGGLLILLLIYGLSKVPKAPAGAPPAPAAFTYFALFMTLLPPLGCFVSAAILHGMGEGALALRDIARNSYR